MAAREPAAWIRVAGEWRHARIQYWLRLSRSQWGVWVEYEHPDDGRVWVAFAYDQATIRPRGSMPGMTNARCGAAVEIAQLHVDRMSIVCLRCGQRLVVEGLNA